MTTMNGSRLVRGPLGEYILYVDNKRYLYCIQAPRHRNKIYPMWLRIRPSMISRTAKRLVLVPTTIPDREPQAISVVYQNWHRTRTKAYTLRETTRLNFLIDQGVEFVESLPPSLREAYNASVSNPAEV